MSHIKVLYTVTWSFY